MTSYRDISTEELFDLLEDKNTSIIDIRPVEAYNGWRLNDELRGGHIKGARSLPLKWTKYMDWIEIVQSKQILSQHHIIVYGYTSEECGMIANQFVRSGYNNVSIYNNFVNKWCADNNLPMNRLEKYQNLVSAKWVKAILDSKVPGKYKGNNVVICHAHYRNREAYLSGHIPGAIDIDTLALEAPETWNRRSPEELKTNLEKHGITSDTTIILYGKFMFPNNDDEFPGSAAGHIGAIRCAFIMMYAGVKDVRVLNGGFQSWEDEGFEESTVDVVKKRVEEFGLQIPLKPEFAVGTPEAKKMLKSDDAELVCIRSWPEYIGEVSGYNYIEKKGRIPGAIFGNCGSDAYHMENYRNVDYTTREFQEIEEIWSSVGITPDKHLAFYCGTG